MVNIKFSVKGTFLMSRIKKMYVIIIAAVVLIAIIGIGIWQFRVTHPTHYRFNDKFVIVSTKEQIIDRYGDFDYFYSVESLTEAVAEGVYQVRERNDSFFFYRLEQFYVIDFDENGRAISVRIEEGEYW